MAVGTFVVHSDTVRSSRVQHHRVARVATVVSVHNIWHSTRGGGYYTTDVSASFVPPLAGRTTTTVHSPGRVNAPAGVRYSVLLDPSDPGYGEFPGSPATKSASWIVLVVFACVFAGFDFFWAAASTGTGNTGAACKGSGVHQTRLPTARRVRGGPSCCRVLFSRLAATGQLWSELGR